MARVSKRVVSLLVPEESDRHANKVDIYKTKGNRYHVNFRNLQIRLTKNEFRLWVKGFQQAKEKLGDRMENDTLEKWEDGSA